MIQLSSTLPLPNHPKSKAISNGSSVRQSVHFQAQTSALLLNSTSIFLCGLAFLFIKERSYMCSFKLCNARSLNQRFCFLLCPLRIFILISRPFISIFIHKYLWGAYCVPDTVPCPEEEEIEYNLYLQEQQNYGKTVISIKMLVRTKLNPNIL